MKTIADLLAWEKEASLLCFALQCPRAFLYTWPEKEVSEDQAQHFVELVARRKQGEPLAYILGEQAFWSHNFIVNSHTLIPRPETEILIEKLLGCLPQTALKVVDVGTGSGIIACTLALERPTWQMLATDLSFEALQVAKQNAARLKANVTFLQGDYLQALNEAVDVIVSNPPYIAKNDPHLTDLSFEPQSALVSGKSGLEAFEKIIEQSPHYLRPSGVLAFEHGFDQGGAVRKLMSKYFTDIVTYPDLSGHERITLGKKHG